MKKYLRLWAAPFLWLASLLSSQSPAQAQVVAAPGEAGTNVTQSGDQFDIEGGTQAGGNLFHEFDELSLEEQQTANFMSDSGVFNIVGQVSGGKPSYIDGQVQVSGSDADLYLVNPSGVMFGPNAQLSLQGSFTATTADQVAFEDAYLSVPASDTDYSELTSDPSALVFTGDEASAVVNQGDLAVNAGESLSLVGGSVVNEGNLSAPSGEIGLVAVGGQSTVTLGVPGSLLSLEVDSSDVAGGGFQSTDLPEMITGAPVQGASTLIVNADGSVTLGGATVEDGGVAVSGEVSTAAVTAEASGGTVALLGESVVVEDAVIDASGADGGDVRIGGDYRGEGDLPTAKSTQVDVDSVVQADGLAGEGGEVVIWADDEAVVQGELSAKGETKGGLIETSAQALNTQGVRVNASGKDEAGTWLIDPLDIEIVDGATNTDFDPTTIETSLDGGTNVTIEASPGVSAGNILLSSSINATGSTYQNGAENKASLTLNGESFSVANNSTINMASTGGLTINIDVDSTDVAKVQSVDSIEDAVAVIGDVKGDRTINLGSGTYDFSRAIALNKRVNISGVSPSPTNLTSVSNNRIFSVGKDAKVQLDQLTFQTAGGSGGGISSFGDLTVENSLFKENAIDVTGGILSNAGSVLTVRDTTFDSNRSIRSEGTSGGAIYLNKATATIEGSRFIDNAATDDGGAIHISDSVVTISKTSFVGNSSDSDGAAVSIRGSGSTEFVEVTFDGNVSNRDGGAVALWDEATATFNKATFTGNTAVRSGGAVSIIGGSTVTLANSLMQGGTQSADGTRVENAGTGGGIYSFGSNISIDNTDFISNTALLNGGGLYLDGGEATITNSDFNENHANDGGGGGIKAKNSNSVEIAGSNFLENEAAGGGGVDLRGGTKATIKNTSFELNKSVQNGAGIHAQDDIVLELKGVEFLKNESLADGGGLYLANDSEASLSSSQKPDGTTFKMTTFTKNTAANSGGAISAIEASSVDVNGVTFKGNKAVKGDGGGIRLDGSPIRLDNGGIRADRGSTGTIYGDSVFDGNTAVDDGGALYASEGSVLNVADTDVKSNKSDDQGGGLYISLGTTAFISDVVFSGNTAKSDGGAIANNSATGKLTITDSEFKDNSSDEDGGAIFAKAGSNTEIKNTSIIGETNADGSDRFVNARGNGGGIYSAGVLDIKSSTIANNRALNSVATPDNPTLYGGGGIAIVGSGELTLRDTLIDNNQASVFGGGLFVGENATAELTGTLSTDAEGTVTSSTQFTSNNTSERIDSDISYGDGGGIAISDDGKLKATGIVFRDNTAEDDGGGVAVLYRAEANINNSYFEKNTAKVNGGGLYRNDTAGDTIADSKTTVTNSRFLNNSAGSKGGGLYINTGEGELTLSGAEVTDSNTAAFGGGLAIAGGRATVDKTRIEGNIATRVVEGEDVGNGGGIHLEGGDLTLRESQLFGNEAGTDGGGIRVLSGTALIQASKIIGNEADYGAGVELSGGTTTIEDTTIANNLATQGGGVQVDNDARLQASRTTFEGNQAASGGAVTNKGVTELTNTTISGNIATERGGAVFSAESSADSLPAKLTLRSSTVSNNSANVAGGGIFESNSDSTTLVDTIVAENNSETAADVGGSFVDEGNNLIGQLDGSTGFTRSLLVGSSEAPIDPGLAPLADNGGLTKTHLLQSDSVAIDAAGPASIENDQRGSTRTVDVAMDIGAVELTAAELAAGLVDVGGPVVIPGLPVNPNIPAVNPVQPGLPANPNIPPSLDTLLATIPDREGLLTKTLITEQGNAQTTTLSQNETQDNKDNTAIRRLERSFSQGFEDYWDLSKGPDLSFNDIQAILQRAQEDYEVSSAVIYAVFKPESEADSEDENLLNIEPAPSPDDLLNLALVLPEGELVNYQLPVTRLEATQQISLFRSMVSDPEDGFSYRPLAQQLYQWLLAPLEDDLAAQGIQNLMYALDSGLRTAPIAAMSDYNGFSLERFGISVVPSVGLMQADFAIPVRRATVAMGVAEFESESPLPAVPIELDTIQKFMPASHTVLNEGTTVEALENIQLLKQPGVLHLATHALFDQYSPESSAIQLWNDPLSMAEFSDLDWAGSDLELLILSACSTALSSANAELGFAGLAAASGVDATIGSLWQVSDVGTLALMSEFYAQLESHDMRFEALRQAQLALLKGETRIEGGNLVTSAGEVDLPDDWGLPENAGLDHPFFWSAFTMVGNPW